jgi:hypothetical protein
VILSKWLNFSVSVFVSGRWVNITHLWGNISYLKGCIGCNEIYVCFLEQS